jgi:hypothetical protein
MSRLLCDCELSVLVTSGCQCGTSSWSSAAFLVCSDVPLQIFERSQIQLKFKFDDTSEVASGSG